MRNRVWIPELPTNEMSERNVEVGTFTTPLLTFRVGGEFIVELIDAKTGRIRERHQFPNLITDAGMDAIGSQVPINTLMLYLGVGTDNTAPNVGDTTLGAEIIRTNSDGGFSSEDSIGGYVTGAGGPFDAPYWYFQKVRLFTEAQANGNLTELGWFRLSSGGTMVVRSLFKDATGTPITVTKTSADQLKVTYRWRMYPPMDNVTGSFILTKTATTHSFTASALAIATSDHWGVQPSLGMTVYMLSVYAAVTVPSASRIVSKTGSITNFGPPAGVSDQATSNTVAAYSAGTFYLDMESLYGSSVANYGGGGIPGFAMQCGGAISRYQFQVYVSESIKKTNLDQLKINWRIAWNRAVLA